MKPRMLFNHLVMLSGLTALLVACRPFRSAADECQRRAAIARAGLRMHQVDTTTYVSPSGKSLGSSQTTNATADVLADMRCDEIERADRRETREDDERDRVEAREVARIEREDTLRREDRSREKEAQERQAAAAEAALLSAVRHQPRFPDPGATRAESRVICEGEHGQWVTQDQGETIVCNVGGKIVFTCAAKSGLLTVASCTTYFEGADLSAWKQRTIDKFGAPESESISLDGFRVFRWRRGGVALAMYAHGVAVTLSSEHDQ